MNLSLFISPLLFLLPSLAYAHDTYTLEAKGRIELRGEARTPCAVIEGKTNLPDRTILHTSIYYERIDAEREVHGRRDLARKGAFEVVADTYTGVIFPGPYIARITFDPGDQYQDVQPLLGTNPKLQSWEISFRVGSEAEEKEARTGVLRELIGGFNTLLRIENEIHEHYTRMMKNYDPKVWHLAATQWKSEIRAAAQLKTSPTVHKILSLSTTHQTYFEDMVEALDVILSQCTAGLKASRKSQDQWNRLAQTRRAFKKLYDEAIRELEGTTVTVDDIRRRHQEIVRLKDELMALHDKRNQGKLDRETWTAALQNWQASFFKSVLSLTEIAPEDTYKKAMDILQAGQTLMAEIDGADAGRRKTIEEPFDRAARDFLALLEDRPGETAEPRTPTPEVPPRDPAHERHRHE